MIIDLCDTDSDGDSRIVLKESENIEPNLSANSVITKNHNDSSKCNNTSSISAEVDTARILPSAAKSSSSSLLQRILNRTKNNLVEDQILD